MISLVDKNSDNSFIYTQKKECDHVCYTTIFPAQDIYVNDTWPLISALHYGR